MSKPAAALSARDVWKTYSIGKKKLEVLRGVSLEVGTGEMVAILGPSGAGKTTLLHILSGIDDATRGKITIQGRDLVRLKGNARARFINENIGLVFQFYHLLGDFTALENVMMPATVWSGARDAAVRDRALRLLHDIGLGDRTTHVPSELSGGEQQRVAIARALMNDPGILFCDEPTGNLDSQTGLSVSHYLQKLSEAYHKTVLIVTHDDKIAQMAGRVLRLKDGKWVDELAAISHGRN